MNVPRGSRADGELIGCDGDDLVIAQFSSPMTSGNDRQCAIGRRAVVQMDSQCDEIR